MRRALPGGSLRTLLGVWLFLNTACWAFVIGVAVYAYGVGEAGAVGAVTAARVLPAIVAAPLAGHLIDRGNRALVVAVFMGLEAAALAGAASLVIAEAPFGWIVVLVAAAGAFAAAPRPSLQAQMPALAKTPQELTQATAAWSALDNAGFLLGSGGGGVAVALLSPGAVLAIAAGVCGAGALLALRLPASKATAADEPAEEEGILAGVAGGFQALRETPVLWTPFGLLAGLVFLEGASDVQLVALALDNLDMGDGGPGALYAAWGVGGLGGGLLTLELLRRRGYGLALGLGAIVFGLGLATAGAGGIPLALIALLPAGLAFALVETAAMGLVPRCADDVVVGRVYGLFELTYAVGGGAGALAAPLLVDWLGAPGSMAAVGCGYALMGLVAWGSLARLDRGQEEATGVRELLRGVPFMTPLPLPRLERLVRNARPVAVRAGETIIAKGDDGEEFFVIEAGTVDIVEYGHTQSAGEGFGEIALIRDIPRTATVRAATDVRLRSLSRPAFLAAITQHGEAERITETVVGGHLARGGGPGPA